MSTQAKTPAAKPAAPAPKKSGGIPAGVVMIILFIIAYLFFTFVMGDGSRFEGGTNEGHPHPGDYLAIAFKGGSIVPILMQWQDNRQGVDALRLFLLQNENRLPSQNGKTIVR